MVRGQYAGYQSVPGVRAGSTVETFVAVKLHIEYLALGRRADLYPRRQDAAGDGDRDLMVHFKRPPRETFDELVPLGSGHVRMRISPDVNIAMGVRVKLPGERMVGEDVEMILTEHAPTRAAALSAAAGRRDARRWVNCSGARISSMHSGASSSRSWTT